MKSITSKDIYRSNLEDELRQISLERSGVELDRFDHLIHECPILDIEEELDAEELFQRMADVLSHRFDCDKEVLVKAFLDRERESSTVIHPGLAIPHVVLEGEKIFDILLVRCQKGAVFSELHPPVKTVVALVGTPDERNYHLRALMSIAHIVENPRFEGQWLKARNTEQLRDVMLFSRPRDESGR